jgi:hypothetical protein
MGAASKHSDELVAALIEVHSVCTVKLDGLMGGAHRRIDGIQPTTLRTLDTVVGRMVAALTSVSDGRGINQYTEVMRSLVHGDTFDPCSVRGERAREVLRHGFVAASKLNSLNHIARAYPDQVGIRAARIVGELTEKVRKA